MIRGLPRLAAMAAAAAASTALFGGTAQADVPPDQDGSSGEGGSATTYCSTSEPQNDAGRVQCVATPGRPGAPDPAVAHR